MMDWLFKMWVKEPIAFVAAIRAGAIVLAIVARDYFDITISDELTIALYALMEAWTTIVQRSQVAPTGGPR